MAIPSFSPVQLAAQPQTNPSPVSDFIVWSPAVLANFETLLDNTQRQSVLIVLWSQTMTTLIYAPCIVAQQLQQRYGPNAGQVCTC